MAYGFEQDYARYGRSVHSYLVRLTGDSWAEEELCQKTFVRYLLHHDALTGGNGSLATWLFRVATILVLEGRKGSSIKGLVRRKNTPQSKHAVYCVIGR